MEKIKIYGTLTNDTGEPIATADQIVDTREGKGNRKLTAILDDLEADEGAVEELTEQEIREIWTEVYAVDPRETSSQEMDQ